MQRTDHAILLFAGFLLGCQTSDRPAIDPAPARIAPPAITEQVLATTPQDRPLAMIRFGTGSPVVLILAAIHGDETTSGNVADELITLLRSSPQLWGDVPVAIIPRANPDGFAARTRANSRGVDLNRNFPARNWVASKRGYGFGGPAPQSEPETAALARAIEDLKPVRIISIHSITRGRECNNYDGPAAGLAAAMSEHNGYPAKATIGYPTPGSLGSWAGGDLWIPVITLELPRNLSGQQAWRANHEALLAAIRYEAGS